MQLQNQRVNIMLVTSSSTTKLGWLSDDLVRHILGGLDTSIKSTFNAIRYGDEIIKVNARPSANAVHLSVDSS